MSADPTKPGWSEKNDAFRARRWPAIRTCPRWTTPNTTTRSAMLLQDFMSSGSRRRSRRSSRSSTATWTGWEAGPRPVDLIKNYTMQVPIVVICEHPPLGVPYQDSAFFAERSEKAIGDST